MALHIIDSDKKGIIILFALIIVPPFMVTCSYITKLLEEPQAKNGILGQTSSLIGGQALNRSVKALRL